MKFLYCFLLLILLVAGPAAAQDVPAIGFGDTVEGTLTASASEAAYQFEGEQGQYVTITMLKVDDFDPYLRLLDANNDLLTQDDDSAGSLNAQIGPYRLPGNGLYTIIATSVDGSSEGAFTLSLGTTAVERIEFGQVVTGQMNPDETEIEYIFATDAGDILSIDLESDDFDAYLTLTSSDSPSELASNDDGGVDRNARIGPYRVEESGDYRIVVSSVFGDPAGTYTLTLNRVEPTPIAFNAAETIEISGGQTRYFAFEGEAGQVVDIRVDTGSKLDTSLSILQPGGYEAANVDNTDDSLDPAISNLILDETGTYYIAVQPVVSLDARTSVIVKLTESHILSLDENPQTLKFDALNTGTVQLVAFTGTADEHVRLHITFEAEDALSPYITVSQNGSELASLTSSTITDEISFGVTVPADGPVTIELRSFDYQDSEWVVTLERD